MSELEGRDLDRAIAELMPSDAFPAGRWMIGSELNTKIGPYHKSLDALKAPEKVLRDAGWRMAVIGAGSGFVASWFFPPLFYSIEECADTEVAARAAAVYAGLKAWKEASGG